MEGKNKNEKISHLYPNKLFYYLRGGAGRCNNELIGKVKWETVECLKYCKRKHIKDKLLNLYAAKQRLLEYGPSQNKIKLLTLETIGLLVTEILKWVSIDGKIGGRHQSLPASLNGGVSKYDCWASNGKVLEMY